MRDYAKKYSGAGGTRQKVFGRKGAGSDQDRPFKIIGVVAVVAMLLGVAGSFWFGVALQNGLGSLAKGKLEKTELMAANLALSEEKEALLQQEKIEAAAGGLGLFPPSEKQMRRP
ncbi:MAG: hypothetical protein OEV89_12650 [Desulfobulbaceae bacterium]|nr:hypothetical protein [Desulfobulbaceae bacterium]HIJ91513.1 hypothetical protein [Deltaproteobacteria bacterium]